MNNEAPATSPGGEVVVYETPAGEVRVDVRLEQETVWLSQRDMAEVFDTSPENVLMHLRNVFSSKELEAEATTKDFLVVRTEGRRQVKRRIRHYNLDAIVSVGYRVNSKRGVRFRRWAARTLSGVTGSVVEDAALDWLEHSGWKVAHEPHIAAYTPGAERTDSRVIVSARRLRDTHTRRQHTRRPGSPCPSWTA